MTKAKTTDFEIRDIVEKDLNTLSSVFVSAFEPEKTGEHWTKDSARNVIDYWFRRSPDDMKIIAINQDGGILGAFFADIKPWWDGPYMIDGELFVRPDMQNKGIGKQLLTKLLTRARDNHKATRFETMTFPPENEHPLSWYLKIGFKKVDDLAIIKGSIEEILKKLASS